MSDHPERRTYSAADFEAMVQELTPNAPDAHWTLPSEHRIVLAALRIAANVMRPGTVEDAVADAYGRLDPITRRSPGIRFAAEAIRSALTQEGE